MKIKLYSILFFSCLLWSCESVTHIDAEAVIEEKVQERLDKFKRILFDKCKKEVLEKAELQADSIIFERAKALRDSIDKPFRPMRPNEPEKLELQDSLELAPLFEITVDSLVQDSVASTSLDLD